LGLGSELGLSLGLGIGLGLGLGVGLGLGSLRGGDLGLPVLVSLGADTDRLGASASAGASSYLPKARQGSRMHM
jgi:hypothetical protein